MTVDLIIGNLISLTAAVFTVKSSIAKDKWHIYSYQVVQCLLLAVASVFFHSYAGIVSLLACAARNHLASMDKLTKPATFICLAIVVILGLLFNNRGCVGWIVIIANAVYTVCMYAARKPLAIKINIIVNLILWGIYEALITDIPSLVSDVVALISAILSILPRKEKMHA